MTLYLLDVNVLIALLDEYHVHAEIARRWFDDYGYNSWSTCPFTEAGAVRILGNKAYKVRDLRPLDIINSLEELKSLSNHYFWSADISMGDDIFDKKMITSHKQITDAYLVALAYKNNGKFVTFDRAITEVYLQDKKRKVVEYL